MMDGIFGSVLAGGVSQASPILFAALGGLLASRAGILDVALEGKMLAGAFVGAVISYACQSAWIGFAAAMLIGAMLGWAMWASHRCLKVDIVIAGLAFNLLVAGATVTLLRIFFGVRGSLASERIASFGPLLPKAAGLPWIGPLLSSTFPDILVLFLVLLTKVVLDHTAIGLRLRAAGFGDGSVATSRGLSVDGLRCLGLTVGSALAAAGGAYLSIAALATFVDNMSAGRGFIALALMLLGRSRPVATALWTYLFGLVLALESILQILRVPSQFVLMLPYLSTLIILILWNRWQR